MNSNRQYSGDVHAVAVSQTRCRLLLRQLLAAATRGDVYVYFASWVYLGRATTERFHWGRIAINP